MYTPEELKDMDFTDMATTPKANKLRKIIWWSLLIIGIIIIFAILFI